MNLHTSWKQYFSNLDTNESSNKNLDIFTKATSVTDDFTDEVLIDVMTEDSDIVVLTVAPVTGKMKILHSPTNLGGTRVRPENKIVALDGLDSTAIPVLLDTTCISSTVEIRTPSFTRLRTWTTVDEVKASNTPTTGQKNFRHASFLILPPFITNHIVEVETRNPEELLILCNNLIEDHDKKHEDNPEFKSASEHCKHLITFLWAASKALIPATISVTGSDDNEVIRWNTNRHNCCVADSIHNRSNDQNRNGVNETMIQSLAHSIDNQTLLFENMRQEKQDEKDAKLNKYAELHDSTKLLLCNASSTDAETALEEPVESCKEFFNKKNLSKALDYLVTSLSQDLKCCVSIETGLVTALHGGHFLRDKEDSPSNFSFFMTPKKLPLSTDRFKPTMILQLKANQGKGWSETDLKDALKQGIATPSDIHSFSHQLKNFWALSFFFFGEKSILTQALEPLLATISNHTLTFEAAQMRDKLFATKLGYAIDTSVFRWLQHCRSNQDRSHVNDSLLNFDYLIDQVLTDSFFQILPTTFKRFSSNNEDDSDDNSDVQISNKKKRRKHNTSTTKTKNVEVNPKTIDSWLAGDNDEYKKCFSTKNLKERPFFKNKPVCQRFHSKGFCFDDCLNKITHVPSTELDKTIITAYEKYVNKCKSLK